MVLQTPRIHTSFALTVPLNDQFPFAPSREIIVADWLSQLAVRKICWIYCTALVALGVISNAFAIKSTQDTPRKNSVAHLMKLIPFLEDCKDLFVKDIA
jgi:hypothetical protein